MFLVSTVLHLLFSYSPDLDIFVFPFFLYFKTIAAGYLHHHWRNNPFWGLSLPQKILASSGVHFFGFCNSDFFTEQGCQPCVQPLTWRTKSLYLCPPVTGWSLIHKALGSLSVAFYDSRGYGGGILTHLHMGYCLFWVQYFNFWSLYVWYCILMLLAFVP
jgi:hypothetical protein